MTMLSVNLNKVALLRNIRATSFPSVRDAAAICLAAGAGGITVHPRPDERHARPQDVRDLAAYIREMSAAEFNVEGNPFPTFLDLVREVVPAQCTLVPDEPDALTSDRGWDLLREGKRLQPVIRELQGLGMRVSLFLETDIHQIAAAANIGADRIELYTEPYARAYGTERQDSVLERFVRAGECAMELGLGVNAGHDLNLENLGLFCGEVPTVIEVSIGQALVSRALEVGLKRSVEEYLEVLDTRLPQSA